MKCQHLGCVVTGAASGLGAQTARHLAQLGNRVALLDVNEQALTALAHEIGGLAVVCNVADEQSVQTALECVQNSLGPIRVLVNCAGICPGKRLVGRDGVLPLAEFKRVIDVNLVGTFNVMRFVAQQMSLLPPVDEDNERGVIINTASVAAFEGQIGQVAYSASKAGVAGLTLPAARELARFGIRVLAIAPGVMETPMMANMADDVRSSLEAGVPFPARLGKPAEFAALVIHMIENAYLNGEVIRLDGGIRMGAK